MAAGSQGRRMVAAGRQPARLCLLRNLGRRRLRRSLDRVDARPGCCKLEHIAGRRLLPGLRARHAAHRHGLEDASSSPTTSPRGRIRRRFPARDL